METWIKPVVPWWFRFDPYPSRLGSKRPNPEVCNRKQVGTLALVFGGLTTGSRSHELKS